MSEEDENIKKAKQASQMLAMQNKAREYQDKLTGLANKEYKGKYKGISITMKGDFTVIEVKIDQSFYEMAGKEDIEHAILILLTNLHNSITAEQNDLRRELELDFNQMQKEAQNDGNN